MSNFVNLMDIIYPVGSIYHSMDATSPVDFIGGTWTKIKTFLYGADTANQTGGEATHTLTADEMPSHRHIMNEANGSGSYSGWAFATNNGKYIRSRGFCAAEGGGAKHTTTCRPTQPASSGTGQRSYTESKLSKSKRGGVCLTSLIF